MISIVCTTFNDEVEIVSLIQDICSQTELPDEMIIADGGSSDNTVQTINNMSKNSPFPIKVIGGKRLNISQGLNLAIQVSSGDIIGIVGTGNRYDVDYIRQLKEALLCDEETKVAYPPIRGQNTTKFAKLYNEAFLKGEKGNRIPSNHGGLLRREVFQKYGLFYDGFVYAGEDTEFYDRLKRNDCKMVCAENAFVWWDVPHDFNQFKKQINNYMIATLQIDNNKTIFRRYYKQCLGLFSFLFCMICIVLKKKKIGFCTLSVMTLYFIGLCMKYGISISFLKQYRKTNQLFSIIKNKKYLSSRYNVDSELIKYLS